MNQRQINFWMLAMPLLLFFFMYVIIPMRHPEIVNPPKKKDQKPVVEKKVDPDSDTDDDNPDSKNTAMSKGSDDTKKKTEPKKTIEEPARNPQEFVKLGSMDPDSGFFIEAEFNTEGASVHSVTLNGKSYPQRKDRTKQFQIIHPVDLLPTEHRTLAIHVKSIDKLLWKWERSLRKDNWKIDEASKSNSEVTFTYDAPDGSVQLRKKYSLTKISKEDQEKKDSRVNDPSGYTIRLEFSVVNLTDNPQPFAYMLDGPIGMPVENIDNTRRFRDVQLGVLQADGSIMYKHTSAGEIANQIDEVAATGDPKKLEVYKTPVRYIGVDTQYFASLIFPETDQLKDQTIKEAVPVSVVNPIAKPKSEVSVRLQSADFEIGPKETLTHAYKVYFGPKRTSLLEPIGADDVMNWGWSWIGIISKLMLSVMGWFHDSIGMPYWLAIIMLTIIVRSVMYPISHKQAVSAKKMKELQPEMTALKKKFENDKEKLAMAQLELMKKHGYSPLSGCLPFFLIFLQLPIFYGLYTGLYNSVDLRMAQFLWIDDLSAPDAMFTFPFKPLGFLGSWDFMGSEFNLLPILTVGLFVIQQKMFMPPAATEEQEMQQKMMQYFPVIIGVLFYKVQSGLCLYFIASTLWSIVERKILDFHDKKKGNGSGAGADAEKTVIETTATQKPSPNGQTAVKEEPKKEKGAFARFFEALDVAANPHEQRGKSSSQGQNKKKSKRKR